MTKGSVLVLCATGKIGKNVCIALQEKGYIVYGTTRNIESAKVMSGKGIVPVLCDYTKREDVDKALASTGCKNVFMISDYFLAANKSVQKEIFQGKMVIDACVNAHCEFVIYCSVADSYNMLQRGNIETDLIVDEMFSSPVKHLIAKPVIENQLLYSALKGAAVLRPVAFFENFDDPYNWNPLKRGKVKFLTDAKTKFCSTYDIGRAAALMFEKHELWNRKLLPVVSWEGTVQDVANALQKVSKTPTVGSVAMPYLIRWLFLNDLHHMCRYFEEGYPNTEAHVEEFKKWVPDALDAEGWFRFHRFYANGESIDPSNIFSGY